MPHYIVLTRLTPESLNAKGAAETNRVREAAPRISAAIKIEIPEARWIESYALIGRYDVLDIFELPTAGYAQRLVMAIREIGKVDAEVMPFFTRR